MTAIEKGRHVKYFLRSGMVLEGIVEEDTASQVVLKSLDGKSLMILHRPTEDIMLTKVILEEPSQEIPAEIPKKPLSTLQQEVRQKLHEVQQSSEDEELNKKSLTELRQMLVEREKQIIAMKRKEHFGTMQSPKLTRYSSPFNERRSAYQPGKLPPWVK